MKFMIFTYGTQQQYDGMAGKEGGQHVWTAEEWAALHAFMNDLNTRLDQSGELVETRGLPDPVHTRRLSAGADGELVVTDGPYAETQEVLAGYWVVEVDSLDRATEIAAEICKCPGPAELQQSEYIDIRPIAGSWKDIAES